VDKPNVTQSDNCVKYRATDNDLPDFFRSTNRVSEACERIRLQAVAMGIDITTEETSRFALVFLGLEDDEA
jgi:hypothetical protein